MSSETNHLPDPQRIRQRMPKRFSWIDQRALDRLQSLRRSQAYGLYLVLLLLGDRQGLSYYSEKSLSQRLRLHLQDLREARRELIEAGLIGYRYPFYQVLDLEPLEPQASPSSPRQPEQPSLSQDQQPIDRTKVRAQLRACREGMRAQS